MLRLFSIGYQGRTPSQLVGVLREHAIDVVVDVRELPWSRKPGFSKAPLQRALASAGIEYEHARFAGNPRAIRATTASHDLILTKFDHYLAGHPDVILCLDALFQWHVRSRPRIALLCFERHPADCHRAILLQHWRLATEDTQTPIVHLDPHGAPRFTLRTIDASVDSTPLAAGTTCR